MTPLKWLVIVVLKSGAIPFALTGHWGWAALVFFVPDVWIAYNLFVPTAQGICPSVTRFETQQSEVWLTIDDGPDPADTPKILDLLDRHQARATFFVVGQRALERPDLVQEILRRGHSIGHHTYSHPAFTLWCASGARLRRELDATIACLRPLAPRLEWFRAPVGIKHFSLVHRLRERGLRCVDWSIRSGDWLSRHPEPVRDKVRRLARPGSIILMHEGPNVPAALRVTAISQVLDVLSARGLRCVIPASEQMR
jgi:peptidoglycan/xylan/chitin deacetylase (PgdA/CDA1 family)